ncbi:PaaI family thioesterase [Pseudomonas fontis]|uniref:PaaI family thioesterase n=1 Tax=Pseudomonas fontis TaxID=2942633 RepID=A0ABT5NXE2_9PSED|nr:PaaI family thioesterase [Pseudomonas fontis]MDD0974049.1 PaaI family thioesterase [Pseudomonas fontis]MDD0992866.1 PaaI family thioesterase [Pseudomonas fontis]
MNETPLKAQAQRFLSALRHCQVLQMRVDAADEKGMTLVMPYSPRIVGNPQNGAIHGGAITTLMDTTCGMAILCGLGAFEVCPTLDLRIDYLHSSIADHDVYGYAECFRVTRDVIFIRGSAYQDDPARPIAQAVGTYMRLGKDIKGGLGFSQRLKGSAQ